MASCKLNIPTYIDPEGCDFEPGSVVAIAFIDESISFTDIANAGEWTGQTYAQDILIHQKVRGSYPKPAITEIPGKGKQSTRTAGRNHEVTFRVSSVKGNDTYWNNLNKSDNYKFAFVVGSSYDLLYYVDKTVSIDAASDVQEGLDTEVDWLVSVKWSDINLPSTSDVPAGIFEE